jgi:hypothetical protein
MASRIFTLFLLLGLGGAGLALTQGWVELPNRWNPWAPLAFDDPPNILTPWKVKRLAADPPACLSALESSGLRYAVEPDRTLERGCGWENAVRISATPVRLTQPVVLACPAAVTLVLWQRHVVQPLAEQHFGAPVTRIDHFGSYACRNIGGHGTGRRSEHARANALDIAGFGWADGRSVRVAADWQRDNARGEFLRGVHAGGCRFWHVVLGPDYNAAHRDHLHLDRGPSRACR